MQNFKAEQRSIWRTCCKRKTAFLCRSVGKVDVALPWYENHAIPLEGSELRRET